MLNVQKKNNSNVHLWNLQFEQQRAHEFLSNLRYIVATKLGTTAILNGKSG